MGAIGVGSMGQGNMSAFLEKQVVQFVAVCDVDKSHNTAAKQKVDNKYGNTSCRTYADFREFLEKEKLDAVCLALPDHWHSIVAVLLTGSLIYMAKATGTKYPRGQAIVRAVENNDLADRQLAAIGGEFPQGC
jgi:predicted dehydrogenase